MAALANSSSAVLKDGDETMLLKTLLDAARFTD